MIKLIPTPAFPWEEIVCTILSVRGWLKMIRFDGGVVRWNDQSSLAGPAAQALVHTSRRPWSQHQLLPQLLLISPSHPTWSSTLYIYLIKTHMQFNVNLLCDDIYVYIYMNESFTWERGERRKADSCECKSEEEVAVISWGSHVRRSSSEAR